MRIATWLMLTGVAVTLNACSADVSTAGDSAAGTGGDQSQGGQSGGATAGAGGSLLAGGSGGSGGSVFNVQNNPCGKDDSIDFNDPSHLASAIVSDTGYVLDFAAARVVGKVPLTSADNANWVGKIAPSELTPPATCSDLGGDAAFAVSKYDDGSLIAASTSPSILSTGSDGTHCNFNYDLTIAGADQVRLFGLRAASMTLDGPVDFTRAADSGEWHASTSPALTSACNADPDYVFVIAATTNGKLIGLDTSNADAM
jgi:hypothetical protein